MHTFKKGRTRKASSSSDHGSIRSSHSAKNGSFQRKSRTRDQEPASFFAGSLRHKFFITDNRNELWAANFDRKQLIKEYYPFEVSYSIFLKTLDICSLIKTDKTNHPVQNRNANTRRRSPVCAIYSVGGA